MYVPEVMLPVMFPVMLPVMLSVMLSKKESNLSLQISPFGWGRFKTKKVSIIVFRK